MFEVNGLKMAMIFFVAYGINRCFSIKEEYLHYKHITKTDTAVRHYIRFYKNLGIILGGTASLILLVCKWESI